MDTFARDFVGEEIRVGDKALWASQSSRSPKFEYRYVVKVVGGEVWTSLRPIEDNCRVAKVRDNSKLYIIRVLK